VPGRRTAESLAGRGQGFACPGSATLLRFRRVSRCASAIPCGFISDGGSRERPGRARTTDPPSRSLVASDNGTFSRLNSADTPRPRKINQARRVNVLPTFPARRR